MGKRTETYTLVFNANTDLAKKSINDLVLSLRQIQSTPATLVNTESIRQASAAAMELQKHLKDAANTNTGKIDLSRFATGLSSSKKTLDQYVNSLKSVGTVGTSAFIQLGKVINDAEFSSIRLTKKMNDFLVSLKNTMKWELSSGIVHGVEREISRAYNYAKSLDKTLNDIRIVSGESARDMAEFAVEANRAAKALNSTTNEYAKASLIFYQQGLNASEIAERTNSVIKMAKVTGDTATDVSSYMTAIWNNFDNGSKSISYFSDVITKLGADTAASSSQIANGLQKFASIGSTVGLSYEAAAAALTTIIDKTQESEDTIGASLRTIFSRIQGLQLGETLEDGTNLNKYSNALAKVGINIKDATGGLKDLDTILGELGLKWQSLSKDTQVALAQTVGGAQQYTRLISLLDNFDAYQLNVSRAQNSAGTIDKQALIYADSWEAASNNVQTSLEAIYDSLIDEEALKDLTNFFADALEVVNGFIKGMGGMKPILATITGFIGNRLSKEVPGALSSITQNVKTIFGYADKEALKVQSDYNARVNQEAQAALERGDITSYQQLESLKKIGEMRAKLIQNQGKMSSQEIEMAKAMIDQEKAIRNILDLNAQKEEIMGQEARAAEKNLANLEKEYRIRQNINNLEDQNNNEDVIDDREVDKEQALILIDKYSKDGVSSEVTVGKSHMTAPIDLNLANNYLKGSYDNDSSLIEKKKEEYARQLSLLQSELDLDLDETQKQQLENAKQVIQNSIQFIIQNIQKLSDVDDTIQEGAQQINKVANQELSDTDYINQNILNRDKFFDRNTKKGTSIIQNAAKNNIVEIDGKAINVDSYLNNANDKNALTKLLNDAESKMVGLDKSRRNNTLDEVGRQNNNQEMAQLIVYREKLLKKLSELNDEIKQEAQKPKVDQSEKDLEKLQILERAKSKKEQTDSVDEGKRIAAATKAVKEYAKEYSVAQGYINQFEESLTVWDKTEAGVKKAQNALQGLLSRQNEYAATGDNLSKESIEILNNVTKEAVGWETLEKAIKDVIEIEAKRRNAAENEGYAYMNLFKGSVEGDNPDAIYDNLLGVYTNTAQGASSKLRLIGGETPSDTFDPKHLYSFSEGLTTVASTASSAYGAVYSFTGALEVLQDASAGAGEKVGAVTGLLGSLGTFAANIVQGFQMGAVVGTINAVVSALTLVYSVVKQIEQARLDRLKDQFEKLQEQIDYNQEELDTNLELTKSLENIIDLYNESNASKEELEAAAKKVAEAYDIENESLMMLQGNYEGVLRAAKDFNAEQMKSQLNLKKAALSIQIEIMKQEHPELFYRDQLLTNFITADLTNYTSTIEEVFNNETQSALAEVGEKISKTTFVETGFDAVSQDSKKTYNSVTGESSFFDAFYDEFVVLQEMAAKIDTDDTSIAELEKMGFSYYNDDPDNDFNISKVKFATTRGQLNDLYVTGIAETVLDEIIALINSENYGEAIIDLTQSEEEALKTLQEAYTSANDSVKAAMELEMEAFGIEVNNGVITPQEGVKVNQVLLNEHFDSTTAKGIAGLINNLQNETIEDIFNAAGLDVDSINFDGIGKDKLEEIKGKVDGLNYSNYIDKNGFIAFNLYEALNGIDRGVQDYQDLIEEIFGNDAQAINDFNEWLEDKSTSDSDVTAAIGYLNFYKEAIDEKDNAKIFFDKNSGVIISANETYYKSSDYKQSVASNKITNFDPVAGVDKDSLASYGIKSDLFTFNTSSGVLTSITANVGETYDEIADGIKIYEELTRLIGEIPANLPDTEENKALLSFRTMLQGLLVDYEEVYKLKDTVEAFYDTAAQYEIVSNDYNTGDTKADKEEYILQREESINRILLQMQKVDSDATYEDAVKRYEDAVLAIGTAELQAQEQMLQARKEAAEILSKRKYIGETASVDSYNDFLNFLNEVPDEYIMGLTLDAATTEEDLKQQIKKLQAVADKDKISLKIETLLNLPTDDPQSYEEYLSFYANYKDSLADYGMTPEQYLTLSEDDRKNWQRSALYGSNGYYAQEAEKNQAIIDNSNVVLADKERDLDALNGLQSQFVDLETSILTAAQAYETAEQNLNNLYNTYGPVSLEKETKLIAAVAEAKAAEEAAKAALAALYKENEDKFTEETRDQYFIDQKASLNTGITNTTNEINQAQTEIEAANFANQYQDRQEFIWDVEDVDLDYEEVDEFGDNLQRAAKSSDDFADSLEEDALTADKAAKAMLRFDRAVENVTDNYEDWKDMLTSGVMSKEIAAAEELQEAYGDLFDIDGSKLSDSFIKSVDNLNLLNEVAYGSQEALDKLWALAADDLLIQAGVDVNDTAAWSKINSLQDYIYNGIQDVEIGAYLNDAQLLQGLSELVSATGLSAEKAQQYLMDAFGLDTEVVQSDIPEEQQSTYNELSYATGSPFSIRIPTAIPLKGVEPITQTFYGIKPVLNPIEENTTNVKKVSALKVTSAKRVSGGNVSLKHSGPVHSNTSRRTGGGGGGGGGSAPRGTIKQDSDKTRYRTLNNQLEDLADAYEKISTQADRAFGNSKVKLMKQQEAALQGLISKQQEYIKEIERYYDIDKKALQDVADFAQVSINLDANGTITNFDEIQDALYAMYNSHINDAGEVIDMDEKAWEEYEKKWEEMMQILDKYDETQDLLKEAKKQLQEYVNELYDLKLEEVTYRVEIRVEVDENGLKILDYLLSKVEDDAWSAAEAIGLIGDKVANVIDQNEAYKFGIENILKNHTQDLTDADGNVLVAAQLTEADVAGFMAGDQAAVDKVMGLNDAFTEDEVQALMDYQQGLVDIMANLKELREQVYETVLNAFKQFNEEMDANIAKMEHLSKITQNYANIIDIVGKKNLGVSNELMDTLGQAQVDQAINQVTATREKMLTIQAEIARAEEAMAKAKEQGLEEDVKLWEKNLKEMNEALLDAEADFMDSWEESLRVITEQFEASVARAVETLSDSLAGPYASSLEELQDLFKRQDTINERYLADYEKIYELSKLNRDIQNSIDDTDNIKGKQVLAELQEQINKLEEDGVQVSEYQVENLRRIYELRLAELALNEAKNTKSEVRMSRNADGDWSYVYSADEEAVENAEQNYEDKLFAIQQANAEYINNLQDMIIQMQMQMTQEIEAIMADETLSMEEKMARVDEVTKFYQSQMEYYKNELNLVLAENQTIYEEDWKKYSELTGYKISADKDYVDKFTETTLSILTGFQNMEEYQRNFNEAIGSPDTGGFLFDLDQAYRQWQLNVDEAMQAAGTSVEDFATDMSTHVETIVDESNAAATAATNMKDDMIDAFDQIVGAAELFASTYSGLIDQIEAENLALAGSIQDVMDAWTQLDSIDPSSKLPQDDDDGGETFEPEDSSKEENPPKTEKPTETNNKPSGTETPKPTSVTMSFSVSTPSYGSKTLGATGKSEGEARDKVAQKYIAWIYEKYGLNGVSDLIEVNGSNGKSNHDGSTGYRVSGVSLYDTGGYTGNWNSKEGRLAFLHEKEIVLNKEDTKNFLSGIELLRQITQVIDLNAYASAGYGMIQPRASYFHNAPNGLQQEVHIQAEFPNATNKNEILQAFEEVVNLASQYANRR